MAKKIDKFYNFSFNETTKETDLYIYGEIISGGNDWKWDETDVTFEDIRNTLESMEDNSTLNMYINSPGGSVFATSSMLSMMERGKARGITINAYIDGLGASCASFLPFVADNLYIYKNSVLMIHRASSGCWGNADDMAKTIELLAKIEDDIIIPMYMTRAKEGITEETFKDYMSKETWFTSNEIMEVFDNVTLLESTKQITACVDRDTMKNFINIPDNIKELLNKKEEIELEDNKEPIVDTTIVDDKEPEVVTITNGESTIVIDETGIVVTNGEVAIVEGDEPINKDVQAELDKSNEKVIALNETIQELTNKMSDLASIVDEYNTAKLEKAKEDMENKVKETTQLYKNKFERVGALDKFDSDEVQNLLANCVTEEGNLSKLNAMLVDMISVENVTKVVKIVSEQGTEVKDLIQTDGGSLSSLFE